MNNHEYQSIHERVHRIVHRVFAPLKKVFSGKQALVLIAGEVAIVIMLFWVLWSLVWYGVPYDTEFEVVEGLTSQEVIDGLADKGLISGAFWPRVFVLATRSGEKFKSGTYRLLKGDNAVTIIEMIVVGRSEPDDIIVTIPEGYTIFDIDRRLARLELAEEGDFVDMAFNPKSERFDFSFIPEEAISLEGYLYPDTYHVPPEASPRTIRILIRQMLSNFQEKVLPLFEDSDLDLHRQVTMASVLQKEVRSKRDMQIVSGILWKRLSLGMLLQVDATLLYGICVDVALQDEPCRYGYAPIVGNLQYASQYNTYVVHGLPAGPISSPGLQAMEAAMNPIESPYFFYLSARKDGYRTIFSRTLQEHNAAREKYL